MFALGGLEGTRSVRLREGRHTLILELSRKLNGNTYTAQQPIAVRGMTSGDIWTFALTMPPDERGVGVP
ncbi:MAG: hypothetical protein H0X67_13430 [Acidobacteria bacterium]|nr:hypothetical protein [Acidobacteriota bacterium]